MGDTDERLNRLLQQLAEQGLIDFPLTEDFVREFEKAIPDEKLTAEDETAMYRSARAAYQDLLFRTIKDSVSIKTLTLGQYIGLLRTKANLHTEVADRLGLSFKELQDLEADRESPLQLPVPKLCDLMEVFKLKLSEFLEATKRSLSLLAARAQAGQVMARSEASPGSSDRGDLTSRALDKLLMKTNLAPPALIEERLVKLLRDELVARRRTDLAE